MYANDIHKQNIILITLLSLLCVRVCVRARVYTVEPLLADTRLCLKEKRCSKTRKKTSL